MKEKTLARAGLFCALLASGTLPRNGARLLAQMPAAVSPSDSASTASAAVEVKHDDGNIFPRLGRAYAEDWNGTAPATPEAPRRGFPAPLASPPFPFSGWPYGGSPAIGVIDTAGGPLMRAIYAGKDGGWWERNRIKIYGWINGGFNVSTSDKHYGNAPAAYYIAPNSVQLDQAAGTLRTANGAVSDGISARAIGSAVGCARAREFVLNLFIKQNC